VDFHFEAPFDPENLPEDMPEEVKQHIRNEHAAHLHHQMVSEQTAHDVVNFIKKLGEHELMLLRGLVNALAMGTESTHGYYYGVISVELEKFGICLACGKKHDDEFEKLKLDPSTPKIIQINNPDAINTDDQSWANFLRSITAEDIALLQDYGVDLVRLEFPKVRCINCGMEYSSISERMKTPQKIDGCQGCQHKEGWG